MEDNKIYVVTGKVTIPYGGFIDFYVIGYDNVKKCIEKLKYEGCVDPLYVWDAIPDEDGVLHKNTVEPVEVL